MARVQYGGSVVQLNGSIAGNTFQRNSSGNIVRSRIVATFPQSQGRAAAQQHLLSLLNAWRNLDFDAQDEWNAMGLSHTLLNKYSQVKKLSGIAWFKLCNNNRDIVGLPRFTNPVDDTLPSGLIIDSFEIDTSAIFFRSSSPIVPTGETFVIYATPPLISQQLKFQSQIRFIKIFTEGQDFTTSWASTWSAIFSLPYPLATGSEYSIGAFIYKIKNSSGINAPGMWFCTMTS